MLYSRGVIKRLLDLNIKNITQLNFCQAAVFKLFSGSAVLIIHTVLSAVST